MNLDFERMIVISERKRDRLNYRFLCSCRTKKNDGIERVKLKLSIFFVAKGHFFAQRKIFVSLRETKSSLNFYCLSIINNSHCHQSLEIQWHIHYFFASGLLIVQLFHLHHVKLQLLLKSLLERQTGFISFR